MEKEREWRWCTRKDFVGKIDVNKKKNVYANNVESNEMEKKNLIFEQTAKYLISNFKLNFLSLVLFSLNIFNA